MCACSYIPTASSGLGHNVLCISELFSRQFLPSKVQKLMTLSFKILPKSKHFNSGILIREKSPYLLYYCFSSSARLDRPSVMLHDVFLEW